MSVGDYTWEEMYEAYIEEKSAGEFYSTPGKPKPTLAQQQSGTRKALEGGRVVSVASNLGGLRSGTTVKMDSAATRAGGKTVLRANTQQGADAPEKSIRLGGSSYDRLTTKGGVRYIERKTPTKTSDTKSDTKSDTRPPKTPIATPASPKVAPTKPAAAAQTGDKAKDMDTWAKANSGLAAASAERDRTRGTSATTNPLMKDMKSRLPAPKTPSPTTAKTGFDLAKKGVNLAASFDMFDVVKGYLIGEGYADTEEAALAIMINMSEEWRQSIVEERAPGVSEYKPNRLNPLPKEKPLSGKKGDGSGYGADEKFKKPDDKITKPGTEVPAPKKGGYGRIFSNIPYGIGAHANRERSRNSTIRGMDPGAPRSEKLAPTENKEKKKPSREIVRKRKDTNESYNIILSYLLDEGYANTVESAEAIISNMSEDWILSIIQ